MAGSIALVNVPAASADTSSPNGYTLEASALDGTSFGELESGKELEVSFLDAAGCLAQLPGTSFYGRIRDKFGHLAV